MKEGQAPDARRQTPVDRGDLIVGTLIDQLGQWLPGDATAAIYALSRAIETISEGASPLAKTSEGAFREDCDHLYREMHLLPLGRDRSVVICTLARLIRELLPDPGVRAHPDPDPPTAGSRPGDEGDQ